MTDVIRIGWLGCDVHYRNTKIEIKGSAFLQTWPLREYSKIIFGFRWRRQWDPITGKTSEPRRVEDLYVFAHYTEKDASAANVLDASKWTFYVASTESLIERFGEGADNDVFDSVTGRYLLVPSGTRLLGTYDNRIVRKTNGACLSPGRGYSIQMVRASTFRACRVPTRPATLASEPTSTSTSTRFLRRHSCSASSARVRS